MDYPQRFAAALVETFGSADVAPLFKVGYKGSWKEGVNHPQYETYIEELGCEDIDFAEHCLCSKAITHNHVIVHRHQKKMAVVGSCCIHRFHIMDERVCTRCEAPHNNWTTSLCTPCRQENERLAALVVAGGETLTMGKHSGRTFAEVRRQDPSYTAFLASLPKVATPYRRFIRWCDKAQGIAV